METALRGLSSLSGSLIGDTLNYGADFGEGLQRMFGKDVEKEGSKVTEATRKLGGDFKNIAKKNLADKSFAEQYGENIEKRYQIPEFMKKTGNIVEGTAGMIPAVASNMVLPGSGMATIAAGAGGSAASEAIKSGATLDSALEYGALKGVLEYTIESAVGGIPGLNVGTVTSLIPKLSQNPAIQKGINVLFDIVGEGAEEMLSTFLTPALKRASYDPKAQFATKEELFESAIAGAIGSAILQGASAIPDFNISNIKNQAKITQNNISTQEKLNRIDNEYSLMQNGNMFTKNKIQNSQPSKLPLGPYASAEMKAAYAEKNKEEPSIIKAGLTVQDGITSEPNSSYSPTMSQEKSVVNNQSMQKDIINAKNTDTFGKNTVGAAERNVDSYSAMQNDFGTIKPGENPFRVVDVPKSTQKGNKVRQFTRTIMEAEATPDNMIDAFETKIAEGAFSYQPKKDKESLATAIKTIEDKGYQGALSQWDDVTNGYRRAGKDDIVLGEILYSLATKNGDVDTAMKIAGELSAELTNAGQAVQATRLLKKSSPEGKLYYAKKSVEYIQEKLTKKYKEEAPKLEIDKTLIEDYLKIAQKGTEVQQDAALDKIFQNVADQVPATLADKWNAWRYLAMLGNTRTHIRNVVGNGLFYLTTKGKNVVGAILESETNTILTLLGKKPIERTKTLNRASKAQKDFAKTDFQKTKNVLTGSGKYNPSDIVMDKRKIFTSKLMAPVEGLLKRNNAGLETEDALFLRLNYVDSMSKYLSANKLKPNLLTETQLEKARSYALNEAQKATFRDASKLATVLNRTTNTNAFTKVVLGGIIPFTKTPINIAKRAIEYSPIGAVKAVKEMLVDVKRGDKTSAEAIDGLASGLTGSGIMALGFLLAQMGLISGGNDEDKKQEGFDKLQGSQNYALQTSDGSYTIDWAAPTAIPLFMGVELFNLSTDTENTFGNIINSISTLSDPLVEMSVLQGINSTINTVKYDENPMSALLMNSVANYAGQAVPTGLGHIARAVDDTRRSTYIEKGKIKAIDSAVQKSLAKIPFVSKKLQPMIDTWGREVKNEGGNGFSRYAYNSFSPGYYKSKETTPLDIEIERLYKSGVEQNPYPTKAEKSFNVNGKIVNLTGDEYTKYAKEKGSLSFEIASKLIADKNYAIMSDEEKAKLVKKAYDYANAVAKNHVSNYSFSDTNEKINNATQKGIVPYQYLYIKQNADEDENGSVSQKEMEKTLNESGLSEMQKRYMWMVQFPKSPNNPYGKGG